MYNQERQTSRGTGTRIQGLLPVHRADPPRSASPHPGHQSRREGKRPTSQAGVGQRRPGLRVALDRLPLPTPGSQPPIPEGPAPAPNEPLPVTPSDAIQTPPAETAQTESVAAAPLPPAEAAPALEPAPQAEAVPAQTPEAQPTPAPVPPAQITPLPQRAEALRSHPHADFLRQVTADALTRLLVPSLEREIRRELNFALRGARRQRVRARICAASCWRRRCADGACWRSTPASAPAANWRSSTRSAISSWTASSIRTPATSATRPRRSWRNWCANIRSRSSPSATAQPAGKRRKSSLR